MPQNTKNNPLISQQIAQTILLALCALIPLIMHTGLYNFALLPKRIVLQLGLVIIMLFWVRDLRAARTQIYHSIFYLPLLGYLLLSILATSQAINPTSALNAISHQITFIILFLIASHLFPLTALTPFLRISAGLGIFVSLIGILEARSIENWLPLSNGRPSATFAYRNFAAAFLICNLPLSIVLVLKAKDRIDAYLGTISTALMSVFLIYTRTRGAWVGFACATVIITTLALWTHRHTALSFSPILRNRIFQITAALAFVFAILLSLMPPQIASQHARAIDEKKVELLDALSFATTPDADRGRRAMWAHTLQMIQDNPLLGVGPGNWKYIYPIYDGGDLLRKDSAPERPHNHYLQIASETGLLALLVYIWFLLSIAMVLLNIIKKPSRSEHTPIALAFAASILAVLGHSMVSFPPERIPTSFLFWFELGILARLMPRQASRPAAQHMILPLTIVLFFATYFTYRHIQFDRHYLRAFQSYHNGDMHGVLRESTTALQWGAFDPQAYLFKGQGYQTLNQFRNAEQTYRQGLSVAPNSLQLIGALGQIYAQTHRLDNAEKSFYRVLELYPQYFEMYNNLGGVYQMRGDLAAAISAYKKAISHSTNPVAYSNLGLAYVAADSTAQGIWAHEKALKLAPQDPAIYYNIGEAYYQHARKDLGALVIAQQAFERFIQKWKGPASDTQQARQRLADIKARLKP